jgi:hypothetical protein
MWKNPNRKFAPGLRLRLTTVRLVIETRCIIAKSQTAGHIDLRGDGCCDVLARSDSRADFERPSTPPWTCRARSALLQHREGSPPQEPANEILPLFFHAECSPAFKVEVHNYIWTCVAPANGTTPHSVPLQYAQTPRQRRGRADRRPASNRAGRWTSCDAFQGRRGGHRRPSGTRRRRHHVGLRAATRHRLRACGAVLCSTL